MTNWFWPLKKVTHIPTGDLDGAFGKKRRFDMHTGVDLYCDEGSEVYAVEDGTIVGIEVFTGPQAGSPWWRETYALKILGQSGVVLYGEIEVSDLLPNSLIGTKVKAGTLIGRVMRVRKYKLKNIFNWKPHTMLHLELYNIKNIEEAFNLQGKWWKHEEVKPVDLLDPTENLVQSLWC